MYINRGVVFGVIFLLSVFNCCQLWSQFELASTKPVVIVVASSHTAAEQSAALELQRVLTVMLGAECKIVDETQACEFAIYLGHTKFARAHGIVSEKLDREEWVLRTLGNNMVVTGGRPRGVLYAAYEMLEQLGVVWSDVDVEYIPSVSHKKIEWNIQGKPAIMNRCIYPGVQNVPLTTGFYVRNRMNAQISIPEELGGCESIGRPGHCHTFHAYTSSEWPDEWFALGKNGKRERSSSGSGPGQICLTHPEVRKAVCQQLRTFIQKDREQAGVSALYPRIYDISHNDCLGECVCSNCLAVSKREGAYSGVMLDFINHVGRDIATEYPEIMIQTFAYTFTLDPPKHIKAEPNVLVRVCKLGCEFAPSGKADTLFPNSHPRNQSFYNNFISWTHVAQNIALWDYWIIYTKSFTPPYLNARHFQEDLLFYQQNNVKTIFVESESVVETSFYPLKVWLGLKLMVDPQQPYEELVMRFCQAQYKTAARPMFELIDYMQKRHAQADVALGQHAPGALPYLDYEFFVTANSLLDKAEQLAANDKHVLNQIARERLPVDATLMRIHHKFTGKQLPAGKFISNCEELFERYATNTLMQVRRFHNSNLYKQSKNIVGRTVKKLQAERQNYIGHTLNAFPEFEGRQVIDLNWALFDRKLRIVSDPEGYDGRAIAVLDDPKRPDLHKLPFRSGVYCRGTRKDTIKLELDIDDIHQDGKFHLYSMGKHVVPYINTFWAHWTWRINFPMDVQNLPDPDQPWEIYASLKLTGTPYQCESQEPPKVLLDRVLLVR